MSHKIKKISPILSVADMGVTSSFYQEILGFRFTLETPAYFILERDGQEIHLSLASKIHTRNETQGHREIYVEVSNVEELWQRVSQLKDRYKITDLFNRDYRMMEFHIEDPDGCLVLIGERLSLSI